MGVAIAMGDQVEVLPGIYDQLSYHNLALRVLDGHGFSFGYPWWPLTAADAPTAHWSFLYTLYLVAVYAVVGVHPLAARLLQAVLVGALTPWLVGRLARRVFPEIPALQLGRWRVELPLLAAAWTAFYLYFVYYSAALMTESFYILGILWTLDCALRIAEGESKMLASAWGWVELGLALGVTVLLRQVFLLYLPFLFLWLFWRRWKTSSPSRGRAGEEVRGRDTASPIRRSRAGWGEVASWLLRPALALLVLAAMIAPFTLYNYQRFHRFILLNTNAGYAFFWANHPVQGDSFEGIYTADMPSYQEVIPVELRGLDEAALEQALMQRGLEFVRADPWRFVRLSVSRLSDHFIFWPLTTSPLLSNLTRVLSLGVALPFMLLGVVLWWRKSWRDMRRLAGWLAAPGLPLVLFVLVYDGLHLLSWAGIRYRLPTDAVLLVFSSYSVIIILQYLIRMLFPGPKEARA